MAYDLSSVIATAENVVNNSSDSDRQRILYPGNGVLQVRILFNPKSNSVARPIYSHKIGDKKVTCARQYKQSCPVCNALETIKTETKKDMWQLRSNHREIMWAQFVNSSADYDWGKYQAPKKGELVLLMLPWSAYQQIMDIIQKAGANAEQLLTLNEGRILAIARKMDKSGKTEYRAEVDAFAGTFKSANSQSEFEAWLDEIPSLMTQNLPEIPDVDFLVKLQIEADDLKSRILGGSIPSSSPATVAPVAAPTVAAPNVTAPVVSDPVTPTVTAPVVTAPVTPTVTAPVVSDPVTPTVTAPVVTAPVVETPPAGKPACFGQCDVMSEKCLMCDHTIDCDAITKK